MAWIIAAGIYNLGFGLFHLAFWRLLDWREQLARLSPTNRAVVQALNLCLTFFFLLGAFLALFFPEEMLSTGLGQALRVGLLLFWILRTALQVILFDLRKRVHQILMGLFVAGVMVHGLAMA